MIKAHIHDPIFDNVQIANLNIQNRIFRAATSETAAEKNGDVRIKGRNIFLDASENIELTTGGKVEVDSAEFIATTQNTTRINARNTKVSGNNIDIGGSTDITLITPKGSIKVKRIVAREVNWAGAVFANTSVPAAALRIFK